MSFSWSLLVLLVAMTMEFWQYGHSCVRQKYANDNSNGHYKKLLDLDTGYSQELLIGRYDELKKMSTRRAIDEIYGNLLCSYLFNCSHYMNLIRPLLNTEGKDALKVLLNEGFPVFAFEHQVVDMLNVLYNFGKIDSVDPLWLVYLYSSILTSLDKKRLLNDDDDDDTRIRISLEHDTVYVRLTQYTERSCTVEDNNNVYDDQYGNSDFSDSLKEISVSPIISHKVIRNSLTKLKTTVDARIAEITKTMTIDNSCKSYFTFNHLRLNPAMDDIVLRKLLHDFAEITDASEQERIFHLIKDTCVQSLNVESFGKLTSDIAECQGNFMNVVKYVMFHHTWKHILEIAMYLPSNTSPDKRPILEVAFYKKWWTEGFAVRRIKQYSGKMYDYFKEITRFFHLEEDNELKIIAKLFDSSSASVLADVEKNKELENTVLAQLTEMNLKYFKLDEENLSAHKFTADYFQDRISMLKKMASFYEIENDILESQLSFFILRRFVKQSFERIDFQVIDSFNRFSKNKCLY